MIIIGIIVTVSLILSKMGGEGEVSPGQQYIHHLSRQLKLTTE